MKKLREWRIRLQLALVNAIIGFDVWVNRPHYLAQMQANGFLVDEKTRWRDLYNFFRCKIHRLSLK